jgi:proline iminopeptidase
MTDFLDTPHIEGFLDVMDYELFYRRFGEANEVVLVLHGGPGNTSEILMPLAELAGEERSVFIYDQFATERSDGPEEGDMTRFNVEHFREELDIIIDKIEADRVHLYGHSWGGMLSLEYVTEYQEKIDSVIVSNTTSDMADHRQKVREKVKDLDQSKIETLQEYEERGQFFAEEYREILNELYGRHSMRMDEIPKLVNYSLENENSTLYGLMWGPNEFYIPESSRLYDWSVKTELENIEIPVLALAGRHDHFDPSLAKDIAQRVQNGEFHVFEHSGHLPM